MNPSLRIRSAEVADAPRLVEFQIAMALETESLALDAAKVVPGVRAVFDDPGKGRYFVADVENQVVGGLLLTYEWSDWRNGCIAWIQSVYVDPAFRRQGIFRRLFQQVLELVQAAPEYVGVRLYVERGNRTAQHTYRQLGMQGDHYEVYEWFPQAKPGGSN